jgi:transposase
MIKNIMKTLQLNSKLSVKQIATHFKNSKTIKEFRRWQCLYMVAAYDSVDASLLADMTQQSVHTIYKLVQSFNIHGVEGVGLKQKGGRLRALLSIEEETAMMKSLGDKASKGLILQAKDIKKHIEQRVGKAVSDDYLWDLFKRNGWVKQSPRPEHPQKNKAAQNDFKKNSKTIWMPLSNYSVII